MAFRHLALPATTPPIAEAAVRAAVEPYLSDVNAMLMLPLEGSPPSVGCNMAIAEVLLAAIGGVSAVFYSTEGGTGAAFQGFLRQYYPWDAEPKDVRDGETQMLDPAEGARILYSEYRNPLAHAAGISVISEGFGRDARRVYKPRERGLMIRRIEIANDGRPGRGLTEQRTLELESEPVRPGWLWPTLTTKGPMRILTDEALYCGLREAIRRLCSDTPKMEAARQLLTL